PTLEPLISFLPARRFGPSIAAQIPRKMSQFQEAPSPAQPSQAEMELRESDRRLRQAQRMAHVGYWERDLDADRITWSDETYRICGLTPAEGTITLSGALERVHPSDRRIWNQAVAGALRNASRYDLEFRVVRPDGEGRIVHSQG